MVDAKGTLKHRSAVATNGPRRAPARAYLRAMGLTDEDIAKPLVGVANTWNEAMPCQINLDVVGRKEKEGIRAAGGAPRRRAPRVWWARPRMRCPGPGHGLQQDDPRLPDGHGSAERPGCLHIRGHDAPGPIR